jgi:hypothetical protein
MFYGCTLSGDEPTNGDELTTGMEYCGGKSKTYTIVNFFDTIYESASPHSSYYDYDWTGLTAGSVNFTDGPPNTYGMDYRNNGVVAAKLCDK